MTPIHVLVRFEARPDTVIQFTRVLEQVRHDLPHVAGCRGVRVFADCGDPCRFTLLECWDTAAAHQAHLEKVVSSGTWSEIVGLLASEPVSGDLAEWP